MDKKSTKIGPKFKDVVRISVFKIWAFFSKIYLAVAKNRKHGAVLFYTFFSRAFWREQEAFLAGKMRYAQDLKNPSESTALLRRNTHRIEKGLLMRPRRIPFASDYIDETMSCYESVCSKNGNSTTHEKSEFKWATDVLTDYLQLMPDDDRFNGLRERMNASLASVDICLKTGESEVKYVPYKRNLAEPPSIDFESLHKLAWRRRSVRWFQQKKVPRELIDKAITVASLSPSACNRQPFVFRIADDPDLVKKVVSIPFGLAGYGHNVPAIAVIVGQQRCYFDERDRHLIYIDGSLAAMSFVYALETLGLSSCCVNWPDLADREEKMSALLKLDKDERPIMLVAFGYADREGMVAYSQKKSLDIIRRYNIGD